jgi:hypothetical protein
MSFPRGSSFSQFGRAQPPPRPKERPVLAVGGRAIVTGRPGGVPLTDDAGTSAGATIPDGAQVEILAWRPRRGGTRYRVSSLDGRLEGWVGADSLTPCPPLKSAAAVEPSSPLALPIRAPRAMSARTRSAPALGDGAPIKTVTRAGKGTRIGTR